MFGARSKTPAVRAVRTSRGHLRGPASPRSQFHRDIGQLDRAVNDLRRRAPDFSAASPLLAWQRAVLLSALSALTAGLILLEDFGLVLWSLTITIPFFMISGLRLAAFWRALRSRRGRSKSPAFDRRYDKWLPTFSVLIPLYREVAVVPGLVDALGRLDYPQELLEILFITEADDHATRRAIASAKLHPNMRTVTVPPGQPKTKPRALNYALQDARGALVAVFDAEDQPEPGQLRRAAHAFIDGGPRLACVQARLAVANANDSFFSRQFALEYAALFRGLLPALDYLRWAIPLGGTSNHFRRDVLLKCGGWDPFNVTEDADLGIRLARLGYEVSIIDSETMEEAPTTWQAWLGQRTRWIKGWMQTYLVHMRRPTRLWRDLGPWRFAGFQVTICAMLVSMLCHPWFYVFAAIYGALGMRVLPDSDFLLWLCGVNFATGYIAAASLIAVTSAGTGTPRRLISILFLPVYWLAISFAAYRAIIDLVLRPFYWEKTVHGVSPSHGLEKQRP